MKKNLHKLTRKAINLVKLSTVACFMLVTAMLNAQTLTHSYTFDTDASDGTGAANGTLMAGATVADGALQLPSNGNYVSFDGATLGLNAYTTVTQEFVFTAAVNSNGEFMWQWTSYFGDNGGANSMMTTLGSWGSKDYVFVQNNADRVNVVNKSYDDGKKHHMVTVMTPTTLKMYRDGVLIGETAVADSNIGTAEAYLGKGSNNWAGDPTWMGTIDEYNIYDGEMDASTIASRYALLVGANLNVTKSQLSFNEENTQLTFDVSGTSLNSDITLTPPAGITLDITTIPVANAETPTTITATWDGTANIINQQIGINSGYDATEDVNVIASINAGCFSPFYPTGNLVSDPNISDIDNFGGWGTKSINTDANFSYCGVTSGKIGAGSIDFTGFLQSERTYRVRAWVYAASTNAKIGVFGWGDGNTGDITHNATLVGEWELIDFEFTTLLNPTGGVFFNGEANSYIDNWEIYDVTDLIPLTVSKTKLSFNETTTQLTFDVTGNNLTNDITLTPPAGITLDITTIPAATASTPTTVTATWDGSANILGTALTIASGTESKEINVIASKDSDCFTPLVPGSNMIADPTVMSRSNFGGWGNVTTEVGYAGACGATSAFLAITGAGTYSDGGCAFDISGITFAANTQYAFQTRIKTIGGHIALKTIGGDGTTVFDDNGGSNLIEVNTSDTWATISYTFTTGADVTNLAITFNSADLVSNTFASEVHIDNIELYEYALLGTDELVKNDISVKLYPNPVKNDLYLKSNYEVSKLNIYDVLGRNVITKKNFNTNNPVDVSSLSSGTYILHATINNKTQVIKFVK